MCVWCLCVELRIKFGGVGSLLPLLWASEIEHGLWGLHLYLLSHLSILIDLIFLNFILIACVSLCVCVGGVWVGCTHTCRGQKTAPWRFFSSTFMWVLGIEFGLSSLCISRLSHLTGPHFVLESRSLVLCCVHRHKISYLQLRVYVFAHECRAPWRPEEGATLTGAGLTDGCELPALGTGNRACVFCKS